MIDFDAMEYCLAFWFAEWEARNAKERPGSWLAGVWREKNADHWTLKYRFRYYVDAKIFDSDDERSVYEFQPELETPEAKLLESVGVVAALNKARFRCEVDFVLVRGDAEAAMKKLMERPWVNLRFEQFQ